MVFTGQYREFSKIRKSVALERLKTHFSSLLTNISKHHGSTIYELQLEIISVQAQKILNHRILFIGYSADRLIFGKKLYLQHICFSKQASLPEEGVYETIHLYDYELWEIACALENGNVSPCQVLHIAPEVNKVMSNKDFERYLPKKIQGINITSINKRTQDIKKAHHKDGLLDTLG